MSTDNKSIFDGTEDIQAFPSTTKMTDQFGIEYDNTEYGMTLRDYFAAKAMQTIIARDSDYIDSDSLAHSAYGYADAMLKERLK